MMIALIKRVACHAPGVFAVSAAPAPVAVFQKPFDEGR